MKGQGEESQGYGRGLQGRDAVTRLGMAAPSRASILLRRRLRVGWGTVTVTTMVSVTVTLTVTVTTMVSVTVTVTVTVTTMVKATVTVIVAVTIICGYDQDYDYDKG